MALGFAFREPPFRQAVPAEICEDHQVNILHIAVLIQMFEKAAEGGRI